MPKKILVLACALALALPLISHAAPSVYPFDPTNTLVWADTVGMLASDSVATTSAVTVEGARYLVLYLKSSGASGTGAFNGGTGTAYDSLAVPVIQTKCGDGNWTGTGSALEVGSSILKVTNSTTTTLIDGTNKIVYEIATETSTASTPRPWPVTQVRFRLKSTNARRYATALSATLSPSGVITARIAVYR